jgi:hypothetical protein
VHAVGFDARDVGVDELVSGRDGVFDALGLEVDDFEDVGVGNDC